MQPVSLYLHIPFCVHRCAYCDFNTYAGLERLIPEYVDALCKEAEFISENETEPYRIKTVFLGGGTPSLLEARYIAKLLNTLNQAFYLQPNAEITMEANPGTLQSSYLKLIFGMGVNRLSIGMQSSNVFDLQFLERNHDYTDVIQAVKWSRGAGFENINLDLIFGIPGQSLQRWQQSLELAIGLGPEHLSIYALTIEDRTPLAKWMKNGLIEIPDADLAADMYELAAEILANAGYHQYEISNWARHDAGGKILSSQHNLQYWHNLPYIGLGAGAHGYMHGNRYMNNRSPEAYIKRLKNKNGLIPQDLNNNDGTGFSLSPAVVESTAVDRNTEMSETMIMGLRLVDEGIGKTKFFHRFGVPLIEIYGDKIEKLSELGLLRWVDGDERIVLTAKGRLLGNQVFMEFV